MKNRQRRKGCGCALAGLAVGMLGVIFLAFAGVGATRYCLERLEQKQEKEVMQAVEKIPDVMHSRMENNFYYQTLRTEKEKIAYSEILYGIDQEEEKITVHLNDPQKVNQLYQMVLMDFPEYFWCTGNSETAGYEGENAVSVLTPEYSCSGEERKRKQEETDKAAREFLKEIVISENQYETIKALFEQLIFWTEYELDAPDNQNIYSVLVNRKSVCAGYAKTMKYLMDRLGIPCIYVIGTVSGQESHAWNIVECQGEYFHVDATWGEPVFLKGEGEEFTQTIVYDYLCCSDAELFKTHTESKEYEYPACVSERYDYYRLNGMYYETVDKERMRKQMRTSIREKKTSVSFKFSTETSYENARKILLDSLIEESARYLGKMYGLNTVTYSYEEAKESNRLTVYWKYVS